MQISQKQHGSNVMPLPVVSPRRRIEGAAPTPTSPSAADSGIPTTAPANDAGRRLTTSPIEACAACTPAGVASDWRHDPLAIELLEMLKRWPPVESTKTAPSETSLRGRINYTHYSGPLVAALSDLHEQHFREVEELWNTDPANAEREVSAFLSQPTVQDVVGQIADIAAVLECVA